jgi:hypothetical protein
MFTDYSRNRDVGSCRAVGVELTAAVRCPAANHI